MTTITRLLAFAAATGTALATSPALAAQPGVVLQNDAIDLIDYNGLQTWEVTAGADVTAGGSGRCSIYSLKETDDVETVHVNSCTANIILGGGSDDGDMFLTDTDGVTTTIELDGAFGFIELGSNTEDGDLQLRDSDPDILSISLDGDTGNVTNQFNGNGLVKAWARINSNGTVLGCYRCNPSSAETRQLNTGQYEVSFSPLGTSIQSRPRLATPEAEWIGDFSNIMLSGQDGDAATIFVQVTDNIGAHKNRAFTIVIF